MKELKIALAGNPNCGKTTLFNELTGSSQYVGNWPGVTVEKKAGQVRGHYTAGKGKMSIIDLPGIYSLSPYTQEEVVARNFIIEEHPDLILNIVDATNIERNLYLTTQLAELGCPMIIALNMVDELQRRGDSVDCEKLERQLGIPVMAISASKTIGIHHLMDRAFQIAEKRQLPNMHIFKEPIFSTIETIEGIIGEACEKKKVNPHFCAVKLFEGDALTSQSLGLSHRQKAEIELLIDKIEHEQDIDHETIIADLRYKYICGLCAQSVKKHLDEEETISDKIDRVVTNKFLAIPIFLAVMLLIFFITFGPLGSFLTDQLDAFINGTFAGLVRSGLVAVGAADWAVGLVCDGIIAGVGSVVSFFPQILLLFFFLSLLEDSGYMSRAAFIMDKLLRKIGLSGRSFVPMLMGFGCSVPAIMAARTLESEKDRRMTIIITPFMSCSARMPVYALFAAALFVKNQPLVIFSIYLLGILVAVLSGLFLKHTVLKGDPAPFVLELPDYRMPTRKGVAIHLWERIKDFAVRAGTILMGAAVVVWFLQSFDLSFHMVEDSSQSILASIGHFVAPALAPLGFGTWQAAVALLTGIVAKESVVGTLGILYGVTGGTEALVPVLQQVFSPLAGYAFLTFVLLYVPCVAAFSAMKRELGSWRWAIGAAVYQTACAWFVSFLVFQIGSLFI